MNIRIFFIASFTVLFISCNNSGNLNETRQSSNQTVDSSKIVLEYVLNNKWQAFNYSTLPIVALDDSMVNSYLKSPTILLKNFCVVLNDTCTSPRYFISKISASEYQDKELRKITLDELGIKSQSLYVINIQCTETGNSKNTLHDKEMLFHDGVLTILLDGVYFHFKCT